jgi:hypothetical protein
LYRLQPKGRRSTVAYRWTVLLGPLKWATVSMLAIVNTRTFMARWDELGSG